jgi:hypothetical protein
MKMWSMVLLLLAGCYMPAARDDFSVMGSDQFSNLIREAYSDKVIEGRNAVGFDRIDKVKANNAAQKLMLGKQSQDLDALFSQAGGRCSSTMPDPGKQVLACEVGRTWKLKNIGASFPVENWSDPAVKMLFRLGVRNGDSVVDAVALEIIDITQYKRTGEK